PGGSIGCWSDMCVFFAERSGIQSLNVPQSGLSVLDAGHPVIHNSKLNYRSRVASMAITSPPTDRVADGAAAAAPVGGRMAASALYVQVAERLRHAILSHAMAPGSWIDEQ